MYLPLLRGFQALFLVHLWKNFHHCLRLKILKSQYVLGFIFLHKMSDDAKQCFMPSKAT